MSMADPKRQSYTLINIYKKRGWGRGCCKKNIARIYYYLKLRLDQWAEPKELEWTIPRVRKNKWASL